MDYQKESLKKHEEWQGKIEVVSRVSVKTKDDLSLAYSPGVASSCMAIYEDKSLQNKYTRKSNLIAVITDGTAVLGLGDIGPEASMPVMEGKCLLFKEFGNVDAVPICVDTKDVDEFVTTVKNISKSFGGINLEDISAPRCFEIEKRLIEELDIPVFHDDQHGTAIVVCAALINALKIVKKDFSEIKIVINGAGSAGISICKLLMEFKPKNIVLVDREGAIGRDFGCLNEAHTEMAKITNIENEKGSLSDVIKGADVFIGVSKGNLLTKEMVATMNKDAIVFALANPTPEIFPEEAKAGGARIVATGRSDYNNQVNNVLIFPGIFKGALKSGARVIDTNMKVEAAKALASFVKETELTEEKILPTPFEDGIADTIANAVIAYAKK